MPSLTKLDTYDQETGHLNIIIETPQGSRNKYAYDPKQRVFKVKCLLPKGMAFPYDFGFIPSTLGDDGDPLDVLVLMEAGAGWAARAGADHRRHRGRAVRRRKERAKRPAYRRLR